MYSVPAAAAQQTHLYWDALLKKKPDTFSTVHIFSLPSRGVKCQTNSKNAVSTYQLDGFGLNLILVVESINRLQFQITSILIPADKLVVDSNYYSIPTALKSSQFWFQIRFWNQNCPVTDVNSFMRWQILHYSFNRLLRICTLTLSMRVYSTERKWKSLITSCMYLFKTASSLEAIMPEMLDIMGYV